MKLEGKALARGGVVPVSVARDGRPTTAGLPVCREDDRLIRELDGVPPPYFLHGPLAFAPAVADALPFYFRANPTLGLMNSPLITRRHDRARFPGEELVVVTAPQLPHRVARGYGDPVGQVDGVKVRNLRHLVELLCDGRGE